MRPFVAPTGSLAFSFALLLSLPACDPRGGGGGDDGSSDADGDGLTAAFEVLIGSDPENEDSDGDGFSDAYEQLTYFDATNDEDFPYEGNYARGPLMNGDDWDAYTADAGWDEGEISEGWGLEDQNGEEIKLKRFFGSVILVDLSAEWCGPCRAAAATLREEYEPRKADGFVILQLLIDGLTYTDPPDAERWVDDVNVTHPVLEDEDEEKAQHYVPWGGEWYIPNYTLIDRNHEIVSWYVAGGEPNWDDIDDLLDEDRPEVEWPLPENADALYEELDLEPGAWVRPDGDEDDDED
jgi:peroxiredoxin